MSTMTTNPHAGRGGGGGRKWKKGRKGRGGRGGRGGQGDEGSGNDGKLSANSREDAAVAAKKQATEEVVTLKMNNEIKQRRGKRDKRGRGGRGVNQENERSGGNGKKSSTNSSGADAAVAPKQSKKEQKVVTPKMNNENNPPQAAGPPSARKTVSFGKNTNSVNLKNALKVGVETPCSGDDTTDQEMTSRGTDGADNIQTEKKEKSMQEKLKEAREQAAAAKEKKKSKKSKKHEKWLKEQQQQQEARAKLWEKKLKSEENKCNLIADMIRTELNRVNKGADISEEEIIEKSSEAQEALYGSSIKKCRVVVVGLDRKDLNGRKGSIRHWDGNKAQFCVGLDTKKSRNCDVHFMKPENLDVDTSSSQAANKKDKLATNCAVSIGCATTPLTGYQFTLEKSDVIKIESAHSRCTGLEEFKKDRDALSARLMQEQEEQRKEEERLEREEEEDRKRRAELRAKKMAEKELKKEEMRQRREKTLKMKQERAQMEYEMEYERARAKKIERVKQMQEQIHRMMMVAELSILYETIFAKWAGEGGRVEKFDDFKKKFKELIFEKYLDDEEDDKSDMLEEVLEEIFAEMDEDFMEYLREGSVEEDMEHAQVLGVSHDVDRRTLVKTYRKLALQYHPDKWSADSDHGMSKEEAEEHFKKIQNAYDHLMTKFDD